MAWRRHLRDGNRPSRLDAAERTICADQTLARDQAGHLERDIDVLVPAAGGGIACRALHGEGEVWPSSI